MQSTEVGNVLLPRRYLRVKERFVDESRPVEDWEKAHLSKQKYDSR